MKKLAEEDRRFLGAIFFFTLVAALRFFDFNLMPHGGMVALLMENIFFVAVVTWVYVAVLIVVYGLILSKLDKKYKKTGYYLVGFLAVFLNTMFFCQNYFGSMDVYCWILFLLIFVSHIHLKKEWISIPIVFFMTFLYPAVAFTLGILLLSLVLYRYEVSRDKKYRNLLLADCCGLVLGAVFSIRMRGLYLDVQEIMSLKKYVVVLVLLLPYLVLGWKYFQTLKDKWLFFVLGFIGVGFETLVGDYGRAIFYGFAYYLIFGIFTLLFHDEASHMAIEDIKRIIKEKLPIPSVVILYPLFIFTIWVCGILSLVEEQFVGL